MVRTFLYKRGGPVGKCEECGRITDNQHHIHGRKWSDVCIWLCFECHRYAHDHPAWAKSKGYMIRTVEDKTMVKKKKQRGCEHSRIYWSKAVSDYVCQFCGARMDPIKRKKK